MVSTQQKGILTVIRSALSGNALPLPSDFDIAAAAKVAKQHQVAGMFYYGLQNCKAAIDADTEQKLFFLTAQYLSLGEQQNAALQMLFSAFAAAGVDYAPLKGALLKPLYPKPDMRVMSDADILIRTAQYESIEKIMREQGFSAVYESNHELIWQRGPVHIELHKLLIPSYNVDYYAYYGDGWSRLQPAENGAFAFSDEDFLIYLFTHFAKHYRCGGIGLKHMTDLWVYACAKPQLNAEYIAAELEKLHLAEFYRNVQKTLAVWFCDAPADAVTDFITETVFASGAYGQAKQRRLAEVALERQTAGSVSAVRRRRVTRLLFPPLAFMKTRYAVLEKLPVLLPLMWPVRWVTALLFRRENVRAASSASQTGKQQAVSQYERDLQTVGLTYRFKDGETKV